MQDEEHKLNVIYIDSIFGTSLNEYLLTIDRFQNTIPNEDAINTHRDRQ